MRVKTNIQHFLSLQLTTSPWHLLVGVYLKNNFENSFNDFQNASSVPICAVFEFKN